MTVARARVIKAHPAHAHAPASLVPSSSAPTVPGLGPESPPSRPEGFGRRVSAAALDARDDAAKILAAARAQAEALVTAAHASVASITANASRDAREAELARIAAEMLVVRAKEMRRAEQELDRTVELATALAERLVGEALTIDPSRIANLAATALQEARGARRLRIEANRHDVSSLGEALGSLGMVAEITVNDELGRGSLVIDTELGRVDARLAPQLERLSAALREILRGGASIEKDVRAE